MAERYTVRIDKDDLVFSSAHFITYDGDTCERLHGHNYRASVELTGPLDGNHYVFDFIALKDRTRELVGELDHRMLLPTGHRTIRVEADERSVRVTHGEREWVFPRGDCVLLPVENTTAELLARHLGQRLLADLAGRHGYRPAALRVEVEESFGQAAIYEWG